MKIFLSASKSAYDNVLVVKSQLEEYRHSVTLPNGFNDPNAEDKIRQLSSDEYADWKTEMIKEDGRIVAAHDAVLVLNFDKHGQANYIGGATFLEMFKAFDLDKKLFLYNPIPQGILTDEIIGLKPIILNQNLLLIK